jgi:hypothetical protein
MMIEEDDKGRGARNVAQTVVMMKKLGTLSNLLKTFIWLRKLLFRASRSTFLYANQAWDPPPLLALLISDPIPDSFYPDQSHFQSDLAR